MAEIYRAAGIVSFQAGNYEEACGYFESALASLEMKRDRLKCGLISAGIKRTRSTGQEITRQPRRNIRS